MYFGVLLSYKIEREVHSGLEVDTEMSLLSISEDALPLKEFRVSLDVAKHAYLMASKRGKLEKAGLLAFESADLAKLIQSKLAASYIYNMEYLEKYDVAKFNLMIEVPHAIGHPTRLTVALEYKPRDRTLRVITLY